MNTWKEPLDQTGNNTYFIDFSKEMDNLGHVLATVALVLDAASVEAGLVTANEVIVGNIFSVQLSIPDVADQVFTERGSLLKMGVTFTSSGGERDRETFAIKVMSK